MTTWFDTNTWEIAARNYDLSYNAGVYDFDVHIEVEMTKFGESPCSKSDALQRQLGCDV